MATCLSPCKRRLVCDLGSLIAPVALTHEGKIPHFDQDATGLLSWSCVTMDDPQLDDKDDKDLGAKTTEAIFEDFVVRLSPYCHAIHEWILQLTDEDIQDKYKKLLEWTGNAQLFLDCFKLARSEQGVGASLSLLLSSAALERALGDVFLLKSKLPCPAMLKNLLATQELPETFGENAITLLRILMGPPTSLNLRNILWHGFAAPDEIPQRYSTFLLVVVASLGRSLLDSNIVPGSLPHRKPLTLPQVDTDQFRSLFPDIGNDDLDILWELYSTSAFFHKPMLPFCRTALDYFRDGKYGVTVVLLIPQLENGLRKLFTTANSCPKRLLTSESEYFTTFDEMLCPSITNETSNALITLIGESFMEMLLDLLVHPEGPRLRDHISHGELDIQGMTRAPAVYVLSICAAFCLRDCQDDKLLQAHLLNRVKVVADGYTSLFHPISLLRQNLLTLVGSLSHWSGLTRPDEGDVSYQTWSGAESGISGTWGDAWTVLFRYHQMPVAWEDLLQSVVMPFTDLACLADCISVSSPAKTLFRPRRELEITSLLQRITSQCVTASKNVRDMAELRYQQHLAKELRSRQRANYVRLLNSIPEISSGLRLLALTVLCQLRCLQASNAPTPKDTQAVIKFLKAILRHAENLAILSGPDKNKWDECCSLTISLQQYIKTYCGKI